jgi:hypothetical protein
MPVSLANTVCCLSIRSDDGLAGSFRFEAPITAVSALAVVYDVVSSRKPFGKQYPPTLFHKRKDQSASQVGFTSGHESPSSVLPNCVILCLNSNIKIR